MKPSNPHGHETGETLDRRSLLRRATASIPLFCVAPAASALSPPLEDDIATEGRGHQPQGLIARQHHPDNLEFPFATLDQFLTPNEQFYVRTHFEVPRIDKNTWRLSIEGEVERPFDLSYGELLKLPGTTMTSLLECSGNGRDFLEPPQTGIRWELGGVSNAEWTGVPLATVLKRAEVKPAAAEVIFQGADQGEFKEPNPKSPGVIPYARSLPLEKASQPEVLLAYRMNGRNLPPRHGYPLRAIVPGWYGMASVKWLRRIIVTSRPFDGYFQTFMYAVWEKRHGLPSLVPVTEIQVKAQIARPAPYEIVTKGTRYLIRGAAWAGEPQVAQVEVSVNGGATWDKAKLIGDAVRFAWRFWEYEWRIPAKAGQCILMARATDERGCVQPMKRDPLRRDAVISHVLPIEVEVR
jgi:DMSO/TMAO reductase YedYZ molybdopterin-dependent catalytic subunit